MIYLAIIGYMVSVYEVYKALEPNWGASRVTVLDLIILPVAFIPVINSFITLALWSSKFFIWAESATVWTRKR